MPVKPKDKISNDFDAIAIRVASPEDVLEWSHGEVTRPETINYRTQKPERDGLFCEKIFGPTKNWECYCGKYKKIRYKNIVCDKCGVEVTRSSVRRERMGHIKLAVPVVHIWYLRSTPSRIGLLLNMSIKDLERVVYFANYIVKEIDDDARKSTLVELEKDFKSFKKRIQDEYANERNELELKKKQGEKVKPEDFVALEKDSEQKIEDLVEQFEETRTALAELHKYQTLSELQYRDFSMKFGHIFQAGIGAEAIQEVISKMDLNKFIQELKNELKVTIGQKRTKIIRQIMLAGSMLKAGVKPEWMIMNILPVIPPDLRPMVQLDGGRFATSDLNDLYRRVINRNNRLKKLLEMGAPEVICRNEKRMLQEAVDALLHNSFRQGKAITKTGSRTLQLKSLSDILKGKQGRFRQNLLGKRVDYSGRSVIVVGPSLKLDECGIPKKMALELFKPFVLGELIRNGIAANIKNAEKLILWNRPEVWDALEKITKDHFVLLNRAPTLHRLGIQAFRPILIEGKAIQLHPLVCSAFNADFDGDQMAVHVPLSKMAQWEAKNIMNASQNLLKPSSGNPIINPSIGMVLGCYFLTTIDDRLETYPHAFANFEEVLLAYEMEHIKLGQLLKVRMNNTLVETSAGRLIFNTILPPEIEFMNEQMDKGKLSKLIGDIYEKTDVATTGKLADQIKDLGFKYVTKSGFSMAISDLQIPKEKKKLIEDSDASVEAINKLFRQGLVTDNERYLQTIRVWRDCKDEVQKNMMNNYDRHNAVYQMLHSGARGNVGQLTQMAGMKGLVINPSGRTIELPVKDSFKEGTKMLPYFIAQHGARKGRSDTALKTASAGYLTRRLVDAVQDILITIEDCGSNLPIVLTKKESDEIGEKFEHRLLGRTLAEEFTLPTGEVYKVDESIDRKLIKYLEEQKINEVKIRSITTCKAQVGICQRCYGRDLAANKIVDLGTAVGIIAAQSIGEPGTQLTMRTFHTGGVAADSADITQGLPRVEELFEARAPKYDGLITEISGKVNVEPTGNFTIFKIQSQDFEVDTFSLVDDFEATVQIGEEVKAKQVIAKRKEGKGTLKSKAEGVVESINYQEMKIRHMEKAYREYKVALNRNILVKDGDLVEKGQPLTNGHLDLHQLANVKDEFAAQRYLIREVQSIYSAQGQTINDKHIEIIARHMFSKCRVLEAGDSQFLPGQIANYFQITDANETLEKEGKKPAVFERMLLGLTRLSLVTDSWLSAASFQETIRVLVEASTTYKVDKLEGLKENVIIGKLIPSGTNYKRNLREELYDEELVDEE